MSYTLEDKRRFVIKDETVQQAFEQLRDNAFPAAAARADRLRREDLLKAEKGRLYLLTDGTIAEREAKVMQADAYVRAAEAYFTAVELDEQYRNLRANAELVIEAWRSTNADRRLREKTAG